MLWRTVVLSLLLFAAGLTVLHVSTIQESYGLLATGLGLLLTASLTIMGRPGGP